MTRSPSRAFRPVVSVSSMISLVAMRLHALAAEVGERVGTLVFRVTGMAFYPVPLDLVAARQLLQTPPQVVVLDRLLVRGAPAALLPRVDPLRDALLNVLRVGEHAHARALL